MNHILSRSGHPGRMIGLGLMIALALLTGAILAGSCQKQREPVPATGQSSGTPAHSEKIIGGGCDGCEGMYEGMPQRIDWQTAVAADSEPGERMEIGGIIYQADGKTPAHDVILYVYHTDTLGYYTPDSGAMDVARRHGHLRGWMKTSANGEYRFTTIRPAPYPNGDLPAHIHPVVKEPGRNEYYIDEYVFDDDPLLTQEKRSDLENRGGSGIIHLSRNGDGIRRGRRDIILGLNIPGYPLK